MYQEHRLPSNLHVAQIPRNLTREESGGEASACGKPHMLVRKAGFPWEGLVLLILRTWRPGDPKKCVLLS